MNNNKKIIFFGDELPENSRQNSYFHVIPVPYEKTVSYGGGTKYGPEALLLASEQLEFWDGECELIKSCGIYTTDPISCDGDEKALFSRMYQEVMSSLKAQKIPFVLGGEHTVTYGAMKAFHDFYEPGEVGLVQFDAHADLRDSYLDSPWSHACVMHRCVDLGFPLFQIGIRSYCLEDVEFQKAKNISMMSGNEVLAGGIDHLQLPSNFPKKIYITFDIDGLDASIMPATGTPVPGGLSWRDAQLALYKLCHNYEVVGMDLVEFAPIPSFHAYNFTAATLAYQMMSAVWKSHIKKQK